MREGRNEPSNLPCVVKCLASAYGVGETEMSRQLRVNAFEFFGLQVKEETAATENIVELTKAAAATGAPITAPATAGEGKGKPRYGEQPGTSGSSSGRGDDDSDADDVAQQGDLADAAVQDGGPDDPDGAEEAQGMVGAEVQRQQQ